MQSSALPTWYTLRRGLPDPVPVEICLIRLSCSHVSGDNFIEDFTCLVKRNLNNDKRRSLQSKTKMRADRNGPCDPFTPNPMPHDEVTSWKKKRRRSRSKDKKLRLSVCLKFGPSFWLLKILMLSHLHPLHVCVRVCVCVAERDHVARGRLHWDWLRVPSQLGQLKYSVTAAFCYIHIIAI